MTELKECFVVPILNKLPFVRWDRYVETPTGHQVYGWIDREDGKSDFILVGFENKMYWYTTSSAKCSKLISQLMGMNGEEDSCKRLEDLPWSNKINCIRLKEKV